MTERPAPTTLSMVQHHTMERTVDTLPLGADVFAVRWTDVHRRAVVHDGRTQDTTETVVSERVLTQAQIDVLLSGDVPNRAISHFLIPNSALDLVGRHCYRDLETLRQCGTLENTHRDGERYAHRAHSAHHALVVSHLHQATLTPFSCLEAAREQEGYTVLNNLHTKGVYLDLDGRLVPSLFEANYIDGHFHDGRYRLEQAAAHLLARPDVEVIARPTRASSRESALATTPQEAIHPIPHYNEEKHRTESLVFLWCPTGDTRRRVVDWFHSGVQHPKMHFWTFVFEQDLLGLRACGAALFQDPHQDLGG